MLNWFSKFDFNFNLVPYALAAAGVGNDAASVNANGVFNFDTTSGELKLDATVAIQLKVGRCRLTLSNLR